MPKKTPDYDNVFKTMKVRHKRLFISVINDIFGKDYPMNMAIGNKNEERLVNIMGGTIIETESEKLIRKGYSQGVSKGISQGREEGIQGTVSILKDLGLSSQTIMVKIQEQYHLSPEASKKYL